MLASFFKLLARSYRLTLPYGRRKLFAVLGVILLNGLLQLVGVTSIFPFFALAADPERMRHSTVGQYILRLLPPLSMNHLLIAAGCFSILMLLLASMGSMVSEIIRERYAYGFCHWLRQKVFESYAAQPYGFFLRHHSAELMQKLGDVMIFTHEVLLAIGEIITRLIVISLLLGIVFLVQPRIALAATFLFGGFYLGVFIWLRPRMRLIGGVMLRHSIGFEKNSMQFFGGIKTLFVHGKSRYFMEKALAHSAQIGELQSKIPLYQNGPRYLIEPIAFGGLVAIVLVLAVQGRPFSDILPNLSVMALAAYRLLPSLQLLHSQLVTVAANSYTLGELEQEIGTMERETCSSRLLSARSEPLTFNREIRLDHLTFYYPNPESPILDDFSLTIFKNESIGIAGPSGAGKSTLVDLILGLHHAQGGRILIDGVPLSEKNITSWRQMIGYVPQEIYLLDESLEANIAFGIDPSAVNQDSLREAAKGAQILDFIQKELPQGFQTLIGERGARLSGGQRQRIGLARALYHHPQVLILDEATSALDHETEHAVMETIYRLQGTRTIITIAHRLSTLERCDRVLKIEKL
jgi:ATP-binding cassette subfamily C protein